MGRPPSNGAPSFRFNTTEVAQMEAILTKYEGQVPPRDFLVALAQRFSQSPERAGKITVQMKQVWNWFQNRRYQLRAKLSEPPAKPGSSSVAPTTREEVTPVRNAPSVPQQVAVSSGPHVVGNTSQGPLMEFEAKSARDGAWYDVQIYLSLRNLETGNPDVLVRFAGFGPEEDEWVNVLKHVRQRSLPCEASECYAVLPGDLILCFQEGKEQALYYDAHVLDAQRRRHDVRGCRCRFLVRYDHDDSEEIVPLRKICRRPETDYRLQNEAAPSTSMSVEPSKPVAGQTSITTSGLTNPNPRTAPITVSPSPIVGVGPSSRPPAPTLSRASTPSSIGPPGLTPTPSSALPPYPSVTTSVQITPAQMPASAPAPAPAPIISPVTVVVSETPDTFSENKTVGSDIPGQITIPDPKTVETLESVHPAQIPVPNTKDVESDNPAQIAVPYSKEVESDNPAQIPVARVETLENVDLSQNHISNKVESNNQPQIPLPDLKKVESDNSALVTIPVPEANKVETVSPKAQTDIPATAESDKSFPAPVPELNKVERDNAGLAGEPSKAETDIAVSAVEPSKAESDIHVSAIEPSKVESDIPVLPVEPSKVESNIPFPASEPNMVESDISAGELSVQEPAEIITPNDEAHNESEIVATSAGSIESSEPTEEVKE